MVGLNVNHIAFNGPDGEKSARKFISNVVWYLAMVSAGKHEQTTFEEEEKNRGRTYLIFFSGDRRCVERGSVRNSQTKKCGSGERLVFRGDLPKKKKRMRECVWGVK